MANHPITIAGRKVELSWSQETARRFQFRASKIGGAPDAKDFQNPRKAIAAVTSFVWLLLPPDVHADYPTPEDLHADIDHETEAEAIHAALAAVFADMSPDAEKKSTSKKSPSRKSNSG